MRISEHFDQSEFERHGPVPQEALPILADLCGSVLEAIRAQFGPLTITSGYRPPAMNAATGGAKHSEHVYGPDECAADFVPESSMHPLSAIFDWIRFSSGLDIDQVILEADKSTGDYACIHIGFSMTPRYEALIGETHGTGSYAPVAFRRAPAQPLITETAGK